MTSRTIVNNKHGETYDLITVLEIWSNYAYRSSHIYSHSTLLSEYYIYQYSAYIFYILHQDLKSRFIKNCGLKGWIVGQHDRAYRRPENRASTSQDNFSDLASLGNYGPSKWQVDNWKVFYWFTEMSKQGCKMYTVKWDAFWTFANSSILFSTSDKQCFILNVCEKLHDNIPKCESTDTFALIINVNFARTCARTRI